MFSPFSYLLTINIAAISKIIISFLILQHFFIHVDIRAKPEVIASQRPPPYPDVVASQRPSIVLPSASQLQQESYQRREDHEQQLTVGEAVAYSSAIPSAHQLNDVILTNHFNISDKNINDAIVIFT